MLVLAGGKVHEDGGCLFFCVGGPANARIAWNKTGGGGVLTPLSSSLDESGFAVAKYNPAAGTPATEGQTIVVGATCYGPF